MLNRLALLVGDPLGDLLALDSLLGLASGDGNLLGLFHWGVGADLLGHLPAVRLDGHLAGSLGDCLDLDLGHCHWSRVDSGNWGNGPSSIKTGANSAPIDSCTTGNSSTISSISTIAISPIACL